MQLYAIRRRNVGPNATAMEEVAERSKKVGDEQMAEQVRWIRSYVLKEPDGSLGTICIYQAVDEEALREHARRVGMPADEIYPVADTVIVREDP